MDHGHGAEDGKVYRDGDEKTVWSSEERTNNTKQQKAEGRVLEGGG